MTTVLLFAAVCLGGALGGATEAGDELDDAID